MSSDRRLKYHPIAWSSCSVVHWRCGTRMDRLQRLWPWYVRWA